MAKGDAYEGSSKSGGSFNFGANKKSSGGPSKKGSTGRKLSNAEKEKARKYLTGG